MCLIDIEGKQVRWMHLQLRWIDDWLRQKLKFITNESEVGWHILSCVL